MAVIYFKSHSVNAVSSNKTILHKCFPIQNSIDAWDVSMAKCISVH